MLFRSGVEIDSEVADDIDRSLIREQVEMGVAVRMAVLDALTRGEPIAHARDAGIRCPGKTRRSLRRAPTPRADRGSLAAVS